MMFTADTKVGIAVQIVAGVIATLAVYAVALKLVNQEQLVGDPATSRPSRLRVGIMDGYVDAATVAGTSWSTVNRFADNYVSLNRSYNRKGGAQFSYSIWIQLRDTSAANVAGKTLFMRGDPNVYFWETTRKDPKTGKTDETGNLDVLVKCPRVRFGASYDELVIEFNTLAGPDGGVMDIKPRAQEPAVPGKSSTTPTPIDPTLRLNAVKLVQNRWALLTFTFEDGVAINDFENGVMVRFYLNDMLHTTRTAKSALRQNNGDFVLLPPVLTTETHPEGLEDEDKVTKDIIQKLMDKTKTLPSDAYIRNATVGDMAYFNYALSLRDVRELHELGPPKRAATLNKGAVGEPLYLTEYNKLDLYNT